MRNRIQKARQAEGGFTLVELLIVIVILGILAAVVVFSVGGVKDKGVKSACEASRSAVATAAEAAYAQDATYPADPAAVIASGFVSGSSGAVASTSITGFTDSNTAGKWSFTYGITAAAPPAPAKLNLGPCVLA